MQHAASGLTWQVVYVVESWEHPDGPRAVSGKPVFKQWYAALVFGPLPNKPGRPDGS